MASTPSQPDGATVFPLFDAVMGLKDVDVSGLEKGDKSASILTFAGKPVLAGESFPSEKKFQLSPVTDRVSAGFRFDEPGKHELTSQIFDGDEKATDLAATVEVEVLPDQGERKVAWLEPKDGAKVKNPVKMKWDVKGMKIVPAGKDPKARTSGHHHVLVDVGSMPVGKEIPTNDGHIHFGKGQTEAEIELPKGKHELTLQFADGSHVSYGKAMSATITVEVE
jgi:hypothetical protein